MSSRGGGVVNIRKPVAMEHLAKYYAQRYGEREGYEVGGKALIGSIRNYVIRMNLKGRRDIKYDLSEDDLKAFYTLIKNTYGERLRDSYEKFVNRVMAYIDMFKNATPGINREGKIDKDDGIESEKTYGSENEGLDEVGKDGEGVERDDEVERNDENNELESNDEVENTDDGKSEVVIKSKGSSKRYERGYIDEMKDQIKRERVIYRRMKEKKSELIQGKDGEIAKGVELSKGVEKKYNINWSFIMSLLLLVAGAVIVILLIDKKGRNKKIENVNVMTEDANNLRMIDTGGVISAADLINGLRGYR